MKLKKNQSIARKVKFEAHGKIRLYTSSASELMLPFALKNISAKKGPREWELLYNKHTLLLLKMGKVKQKPNQNTR